MNTEPEVKVKYIHQIDSTVVAKKVKALNILSESLNKHLVKVNEQLMELKSGLADVNEMRVQIKYKEQKIVRRNAKK